jgi:Protein of unknown function (DUF3303)
MQRPAEEEAMKFMVTFTGNPSHFKEAVSRFLKTGAASPEGVKRLGRWHGPFQGWVLAETDDLKKVYEWTTRWSDLLEFTVVPVLEDAELGEVLSKLA